MQGIIRVNTGQFRSVLNDYRKFSKRDITTIIDTKGFYIARGAVRNTPRVAAAKIKSELTDGSAINDDAPLAAIIINSRRGKLGLPGLYGPAMRAAVKSLVAARIRTRAFIASGFLPAVKAFEPYAENKGRAPRKDSTVKQLGRPKGSGTPAGRDAWIARALITNFANAIRDRTNALGRYATPALQEAFNDEAASMKQYIIDKMQKTANRFNARKH